MSNSSLVDFTQISPNSNPRKYPIKKITIHHMAGNGSIETVGGLFASPDRKGSSNYGIGTDGRVGLYVEEKNRAWTSSNSDNDHQAITIEVANDEIGGNWHVSDTALKKLIEMCVDICKRNGIEKLNYTGDKTGNLTRHNMFAATACPGAYLQSKFPYIAETVNKLIGGEDTLENALAKLVKHGIINSPDYWKLHKNDVQYLELLITNIASKIPDNAPYPKSDTLELDIAIEYLRKQGVINTAAYWRANAGKVKFLDLLIIRSALVLGAKPLTIRKGVQKTNKRQLL